MKLESLKSSKFEALSENGMKLVVGGAGEWRPTDPGSSSTGRTKVVNGITYHEMHVWRSDEMSCSSFTNCQYRYHGDSNIWV